MEPGKGQNVWYCIGYVNARAKADAVALHDCDILTYDRMLLARLSIQYQIQIINLNFVRDIMQEYLIIK